MPIIDGTSSVLLSCPHCIAHYRDGKLKYPEPETLSLAKDLNEIVGCPVIYNGNENEDPNWLPECSYKRDLTEYVTDHDIRFLIDLHQMASERRQMIEIGTGCGANVKSNERLVGALVTSLLQHGLRSIYIDDKFCARGANTIAAFTAKTCHIPSLQVEMNSGIVLDESPNRKSVVSALSDFLLSIDDEVRDVADNERISR